MKQNKTTKIVHKKWWVLLLAVIMVVGISGCGSKADEPKKVDGKGEVATEAKKEDKKEDKKKNEPKIFKIGDTVQLKDFKIVVNGIRTLTKDKSGILEAEEGKEFLLVSCTVENISDKEQAVSSMIMFDVVDKDGMAYDQEMFTDTNGQLDGTIGVGRKIKGEYVVQVPKGKKGLELVFDSSLLSGGQVIVNLR